MCKKKKYHECIWRCLSSLVMFAFTVFWFSRCLSREGRREKNKDRKFSGWRGRSVEEIRGLEKQAEIYRQTFHGQKKKGKDQLYLFLNVISYYASFFHSFSRFLFKYSLWLSVFLSSPVSFSTSFSASSFKRFGLCFWMRQRKRKESRSKIKHKKKERIRKKSREEGQFKTKNGMKKREGWQLHSKSSRETGEEERKIPRDQDNRMNRAKRRRIQQMNQNKRPKQ